MSFRMPNPHVKIPSPPLPEAMARPAPIPPALPAMRPVARPTPLGKMPLPDRVTSIVARMKRLKLPRPPGIAR